MAVSKDVDFSFVVKHALSSLNKDKLVLKQEQLDSMQYVYEGKDVFIWLPTEYGKSITFPFSTKSPPPTQSVVLVMSPLVSIMKPIFFTAWVISVTIHGATASRKPCGYRLFDLGWHCHWDF